MFRLSPHTFLAYFHLDRVVWQFFDIICLNLFKMCLNMFVFDQIYLKN